MTILNQDTGSGEGEVDFMATSGKTLDRSVG